MEDEDVIDCMLQQTGGNYKEEKEEGKKEGRWIIC